MSEYTTIANLLKGNGRVAMEISNLSQKLEKILLNRGDLVDSDYNLFYISNLKINFIDNRKFKISGKFKGETDKLLYPDGIMDVTGDLLLSFNRNEQLLKLTLNIKDVSDTLIDDINRFLWRQMQTIYKLFSEHNMLNTELTHLDLAQLNIGKIYDINIKYNNEDDKLHLELILE